MENSGNSIMFFFIMVFSLTCCTAGSIDLTVFWSNLKENNFFILLTAWKTRQYAIFSYFWISFFKGYPADMKRNQCFVDWRPMNNLCRATTHPVQSNLNPLQLFQARGKFLRWKSRSVLFKSPPKKAKKKGRQVLKLTRGNKLASQGFLW